MGHGQGMAIVDCVKLCGAEGYCKFSGHCNIVGSISGERRAERSLSMPTNYYCMYGESLLALSRSLLSRPLFYLYMWSPGLEELNNRSTSNKSSPAQATHKAPKFRFRASFSLLFKLTPGSLCKEVYKGGPSLLPSFKAWNAFFATSITTGDLRPSCQKGERTRK